MKIRKIVVIILTVLCAFVSIANTAFYYVLPLYVSHRLNTDIDKASSIGIIGGADGPTTILVSAKHPLSWLPWYFRYYP